MSPRLTNTVAVDDAPFSAGHRGDVPVVGAVCAGTRLDGMLVGRVRRDGANATARLVELIGGSRFLEHTQLVMLQGLTLAGFNVIDATELGRALDRPVLVVVRRRPDMDSIRAALHGPVPGGLRKWRIIERQPQPERIGELYVQRIALTSAEARSVVRTLTGHGKLPEPLRLAHILAAGFALGSSHGRA